MSSRRRQEGYLLIDNRHAPAFTCEQAAALGQPGAVGGAGVVELPVLTCSHCQKQMIVQPLRTRDRPYCRKCDHYICDNCALLAKLDGGECETFNAKLDRIQEGAARSPLII